MLTRYSTETEDVTHMFTRLSHIRQSILINCSRTYSSIYTIKLHSSLLECISNNLSHFLGMMAPKETEGINCKQVSWLYNFQTNAETLCNDKGMPHSLTKAAAYI